MYNSFMPKKEEKKETYILKCGKIKEKKKLPSILDGLDAARKLADEANKTVSLFRENEDGTVVFMGTIEHFTTDFFSEITKEYKRRRQNEEDLLSELPTG